MRRIVAAALVLALPLTGRAQAGQTALVPSDQEIHHILVDRIDRDHQSVGIVVGVIEPNGRRVISYGHQDTSDPRPLTRDTVFEIGSITKVFTSLLLADMVQRGEVALNDPVVRYLPAGTKVPGRNGRQIALIDLATHTSGLPRLPTNLLVKDLSNPYADYTVEQLYAFLATYALRRDIGAIYEYSNLGGGLLGHVLARRAGMDYEALVHARVTGPLGMANTGIMLSVDQQTRLAVGHNAKLTAVPTWDLPTLAGAGALRSTANDLLRFLAASLGTVKSTLAPGMAAMLTARRPTGTPDLDVALGWHVLTRNGHDLFWHNGGTGGYRSFMGYDPITQVGVVVLSNASTSAGVDDIGSHLLDARLPLLQAQKTHTEITVDAKLFEGYVGRYTLAPNFILTITREGDHLFAQATGQPKFELFAEGAKDYFFKVVDAQVTFETDALGQATGVVLHQNGVNLQAKRVE
jgi:D-alanyl-D-alanine-carboxypeptidase/D-alanyl-D-alanine-endopeptidase